MLTALAFILAALPTASAHPHNFTRKAQDSLTLEPGKLIEQQVRDGQKHSYLLALTAGQYCRLTIETGSAILRIISPAGQKLVEKNGTHLFNSQGRIDLIAETSGHYTVELSQVSGKVDGSYTLKLEEVRSALEKDSLRLQARRMMDGVEALDLFLQPREVRQQSIPKVAAALPLWQASGDRWGEADGLFFLGELHFGVEPQQGMRHLNEALTLYRELEARKDEAMVLYELARFHRNLGDNRAALDYFEQSLALRRHLNHPRAVAETCMALGKLHGTTGELTKALELFHQAAQIYRVIADHNNLATALQNLGITSFNLGNQRQAVAYYEEAMSLRSVAGSVKGEAVALTQIGNAYLLLGDYQRARDSYLQAIPRLREQGDIRVQVLAFSGLGQAYLALGENQKAVEAIRQAIATDNLRPLDPSDVIAAFNYLCEAHVKLGEYDQAIEACHESQRLSEKAAYLNFGSVTQRLLGTIAWKRGDLTSARAHFEAAIKLVESLRSKAVLSARRATLLGSRQRFYSDYIELLMELNRRQPKAGHDRFAFQASERARARSLLESLIEARADIREGVEPALLAQEKSLQRQLEAKAAEQTRLLSGKYTEAQVAALAKTIAELTTGYESVQSEIRQRSPRYAALIQPQPLSASEIQKEVVADDGTLLLEYALGEEQSFLFAITANSFHSYELPKGEVIEQASQRVYDLLTARNQIVRFETAEDRQARLKKADAEFQTAAAELSRMILSPIAAELRAKRPKQLLIVADGKLQYVPFAALPIPATRGRGDKVTGERTTNRPVAASPRRPVPLIANYEIVYLPSASTLAVLRRELKDRKPAPKTLAVFADPVFEGNDERLPAEIRERLARERQTAPATGKDKPEAAALAADELTRAIRDVGLDGERGGLARLPFSREEANAILKLAPDAERFSALDFDANQDAATKPEMSQYRYVHFATHGLVDNQTPELSGLVLSQLDAEGRDRDGYLRMVEIYNLNLPAELVVLSACKTGLGKEVRGEGLISLTRGFMYAGAARVVVSLWDVNDKSTASLMEELYRGLLTQKLRPSAALRAAQLKMLNSQKWAAPYYWAAFVQHGEPR
ncbi:MAG: CHAT domain-containing protein [Acidobacteriota bacterium]